MAKKPNALLQERVNVAFGSVMYRNGTVTYPELFIEMGILSKDNYKAWQKGQVPFLEKVITCNLTKLLRIHSAVRSIVRERKLPKRLAAPPKGRYSKTNASHVEEEYRAIYGCGKPAKKVTIQKSGTPSSGAPADCNDNADSVSLEIAQEI